MKIKHAILLVITIASVFFIVIYVNAKKLQAIDNEKATNGGNLIVTAGGEPDRGPVVTTFGSEYDGPDAGCVIVQDHGKELYRDCSPSPTPTPTPTPEPTATCKIGGSDIDLSSLYTGDYYSYETENDFLKICNTTQNLCLRLKISKD